jgi:hypothetical protein
MQPSWSIPIPQAMQQHGGSAKSPAVTPAPAQTGPASESGVCAREIVAARANEAGPAR